MSENRCCEHAVYHANPAGSAPYWTCELHERIAALEAKLEAMRNAAAIAIVALAHYSTSDNELDNVREMLEGAIAAQQEEEE